jgi:hypothetical protein
MGGGPTSPAGEGIGGSPMQHIYLSAGGGGTGGTTRNDHPRVPRPYDEECFVDWFNKTHWYSHEPGDFVLDAIRDCPLPILLAALGGEHVPTLDARYADRNQHTTYWRFTQPEEPT